MEPTTTPRIKVCCIGSVEEAQLAVRSGASAVGLVSEMPSGPGVIAESVIAEVAATIPPGVASFLLTAARSADRIIAQQKRTRINTLQLVDWVGVEVLQRLRADLPGIGLVQVIHIRGQQSVEEARLATPFVDALLLDSGNPSLAVKELGGTGRVHDWNLSRRIREVVDVPVFLAGGLNDGNAAEAVREVGPYALDICTGVRTDGRLDADKLARFFAAILTCRITTAFGE